MGRVEYRCSYPLLWWYKKLLSTDLYEIRGTYDSDYKYYCSLGHDTEKYLIISLWVTSKYRTKFYDEVKVWKVQVFDNSLLWGILLLNLLYLILPKYVLNFMIKDSPVSKVTGYRLDSQCLILDRGRYFSLFYSIQTRSGAHPVSYKMSAGGSFPLSKVARVRSWSLISI